MTLFLLLSAVLLSRGLALMFLRIIKRKAFSLPALFLDKVLLCEAATLQCSNSLAILTMFYIFYVLPQKDFLKWRCSFSSWVGMSIFGLSLAC